MVVVAQLVEHRVVVPGVAGSSPVDHPTYCQVTRPDCDERSGLCRIRRPFSAAVSVLFGAGGNPAYRPVTDRGSPLWWLASRDGLPEALRSPGRDPHGRAARSRRPLSTR